jgi:malate dehydrogenase (oxaloacetate-decarboxylating)(NADP+)
MLSFSNYGSTQHPYCEKVRLAVELVREREPGLLIDGEMQADAATSPELLEKNFPFSRLRGGAKSWSSPISLPAMSPTSCCALSVAQRPSVLSLWE